jgi:hypothetical protein
MTIIREMYELLERVTGRPDETSNASAYQDVVDGWMGVGRGIESAVSALNRVKVLMVQIPTAEKRTSNFSNIEKKLKALQQEISDEENAVEALSTKATRSNSSASSDLTRLTKR